MNPARSLAPALVSGTWESQWLYVVGPMLGAILGALTYQFIRGEHISSVDDEDAPSGALKPGA